MRSRSEKNEHLAIRESVAEFVEKHGDHIELLEQSDFPDVELPWRCKICDPKFVKKARKGGKMYNCKYFHEHVYGPNCHMQKYKELFP